MFAILAIGVRPASAQTGSAEPADVQELPGASLSVLADESAVGCPDARNLAAAIRPQLHGTPGTSTRTTIVIELELQLADYVARISVRGRKTGERILRVPGTDCLGMRDALIVTLALIVDEEAEPRATMPAAPPTRIAPTVPEAQARHARRALALAVGAALTQGLPYEINGALRSDLEFSSGYWNTAVGVFWAPKREMHFDPGTVDVHLWGGQARGCRFIGRAPAKSLSAALCAEGIVAKLTGQGHGFSSTQAQVRPWTALGASAWLGSGYAAPVGWAFRAVATFPLRQDAFNINGIPGEAYRMPGISLGIEALLRWRIL